MDYKRFQSRRVWLHFISMPLIWFPLIAILLLDIFVSIYQIICFPIYHIKKVKRAKYILVRDRNKLAYLNPLEKISCMYCGYVNGFLLYAKEIAGLTEKYWCGVMHEAKPGFKVQTNQIKQEFSEFGDEEDFKKKYGI